MLITKLYGQNEDIFYLSKKVGIKIEIPNGFINFLNKFPILSLFPSTTLSIDNLAKLIVPKEINHNIQIVANYLKALKEHQIDDKDLYFEDITPEAFFNYDTKIPAEILSQEECQKLPYFCE